jgi:large subunit ribosomal protein L28e
LADNDFYRVYKSVADAVGKKSYRGDLNSHAIARASAIKNSQRPKKDTPEKKPRGAKASKAEA